MKVFIFDFDGTVANTLPNAFSAFREVFKTFNDEVLTDQEIESLFGPSEKEIIRGRVSEAHKEKAVELYYDLYEKYHERYVESSAEMDHLLKDLKQKGYKLALATGKARRSLLISLDKLKMTELFDCIVTNDDVSKAKPDPESIDKIKNELAADDKEIVMIGDSQADIESGNRAGVMTIGVSWFVSQAEGQFKVEPDKQFKTIKAFRQFLKEEGIL